MNEIAEIDAAAHDNIASALCGVMGEITTLEKTAKNAHGNYEYASVDDFLNAVRPLCAKHGVIIRQDEAESTVVNDWLNVKFRYTIFHTSGAEMDGGYRSIAVNAKMGSQAYGSAQSYSLKQYLRALLMIATGDQAEEEGVMEPAQLVPKNSKDTNWKGPLGTVKLKEVMRFYIETLDSQETVADLESLGGKMAVSADDMPKNSAAEWDGGMTFNDVFAQCEHDQPGWITGDGMPELFIPFNSHMDAAMDRCGANGGND